MGRLPVGKTGEKHAIGYLWPHHRSMARDFVAGYTPTEVAERFGFTKAQITRIQQSPLFVAEMARLEAQAEHVSVDVHNDIREMAARAVEILDENLHREDVKRGLKTKTAFDVLDRAGYGKKDDPQKHVHLHAHAVKKIAEMDKDELYEEIIDLVEEE